jgi:Spy/CpxP family protein refolding chaperone
MKNNILKIILIFSLLLNASMLLTAGYIHYYKQPISSSFPFGSDQRPGAIVQGCLLDQLSLKPEQQQAMKQKAVTFHADIQKMRQQIVQKRAILVSHLREDKPDGQAISAAIADINRLQEDVQKMIVRHMLEFKGMLDKEQQEKFLDLIEGVMAGKPGARCP